MSLEKICIVGSGNWGSTIAKIIGRNVQPLTYQIDPDVRLWVHEEIVDGRKLSEIINTEHENVKYLPGIQLPANVRAVTDLAAACDDASILVFVLPHQFLTGALEIIKGCGRIRRDCRAISLIKGLDTNGAGMVLASQVIERSLGICCSVMMGANLANEIAMEMFCESTIGARTELDGITFQRLLETSYFKLAVVPEVIVVELCGALKNIVAVGAGFVDGMLMGDNTKAAVIRIGLDEIRRFSRLASCESVSDSIFFESCGVADLITSCFGGRNRRIGEAHVTTGKPIEKLEAELLGGQKLQGPPTAREVYKFLQAQGVESEYPLMTAIYQICYEGYPPQHLIQSISKTRVELRLMEEHEGTFPAAVVFCPHPSDGTIIYVGRSTYGDKVGGVPGGKLEPGETFRNAAIREFKEETGLELDTVSPAPLWSGVAVKSGAFVQWFLGTLSEETWAGLPSSFMGPEGLLVRRERWELMCYEGHCEYFEFYRRFLQNLASSPASSKMFKEHGVSEAVLNRIRMSVNNLIAERE